MASSLSSVSSRTRRLRNHLQEGRNDCAYGSLEVVRTSWTQRNLGRRFHGCRFYDPEGDLPNNGGCNHFKWVDGEMSLDKAKEIMYGLKLETWRLQRENIDLKRRLDCMCNESSFSELEGLIEDVRVLKFGRHNESLELGRVRKQLKIAIAVVVLLLLIVLYETCSS